MKRLLFFINTLNGGGAEKALVEMVNSLDTQKFQITVQTFWDAGIHRSSLHKGVAYKSIIRTQNPVFQRVLAALYIKVFPDKWLYNRFVKAEYDYEIAYLEGLPTRIIANSTSTKVKKIAWLHTDLFQYPDSESVYSKVFTEQTAYEKVDQIICVSESVRKSLLKKYQIPMDKTKVLYNVVDDETVRKNGAMDCNEEIRQPLIVSAGRLTEQKAFDRLLRVHKRLIDDGMEHTLWIIGEGEKRQELEAYIRENGLSDAKLLGFQKNPYAYMSKADLFVSSSVAEGFSTVITESVILGVPVISTNTAGAYEPPEAPRCSTVVNDEEELYEAIKTALRDPKVMQDMKNDAVMKQPFFKKNYFVKKIEEIFS